MKFPLSSFQKPSSDDVKLGVLSILIPLGFAFQSYASGDDLAEGSLATITVPHSSKDGFCFVHCPDQ